MSLQILEGVGDVKCALAVMPRNARPVHLVFIPSGITLVFLGFVLILVDDLPLLYTFGL